MRQFYLISHCLAWSDTIEFNRRPCPNDKIYDDEIFADRFRYQFRMFEVRLLIGLSRFLSARIAYEIAIAKITAEFCRISHCLAWIDTVEFNRLPCINDKMYDHEIFAGRFRHQLTMFEKKLLIGLSRPLDDHIAYEISIAKITAVFFRIYHCLAWFDTVDLNSLPCPNDKMYDDDVFDNRLHFQLTMCEICILIGLSRQLLHVHIAY